MRKKRASLLLTKTLLICAPLAIVCLPGCKKKSNATTYANVMFVNGCSGSANISAKANENIVNGGSGIIFPGYSVYGKVVANTSVTVNFYQVAGNKWLCSGTSNFSPNGNYTVYAGGLSTSPDVVITTDDVSAPKAGMAKVRF